MNFKGTKGKWELTDRKRSIEVKVKPSVYKSICTSSGNTKWQYDMLLISKAPEMLEMLSWFVKEFTDIYHEGTEIDNKVKEAKQLIKLATEL